jgi:hypothetical protein
VLQRQGHLDRARLLHERALAIDEARLGPDHRDTAKNLTNLGTLLSEQGDLAAARAPAMNTPCGSVRLVPERALTVGSRQALAAVIADLENRR